jgi:hypothetical protein
MKRLHVAVAFALASCALAPLAYGQAGLVCCGQEEVFILDASDPGAPRKVWSWRAAHRPDLPAALQSQFRTVADCRPVEGGKYVLLASSSGGVALVEHPSGWVVFHASVQNAHSAELLPRDRLVVAGSTGEEGNRLVLFDLGASGKAVFVDPLHSGHGVVWDPEREFLWALGGPELRSYRLRDWETDSPTLERTGTFELPDPGGHDLRAIPGSQDLVITSNGGVHLFDRDTGIFRAHPSLARAAGVKSVDVHPASGRLVFVQAEERWWAYHIRFLEPEGEIHLPDERLYKVRWYERPQVTEPETAEAP